MTGTEIFEVYTNLGDFWQIDSVLKSENEAKSAATRLFSRPPISGVRIVRTWRAANGSNREDITFERVKSNFDHRHRAARAVRFDQIPKCRQHADLTRFPARLVINRLFRAYLAERAALASEILHNSTLFQAALDDGMMVQSVVAGVARLQTESEDERGQTRDTLFKMLEERRSELRSVRDFPEIDWATDTPFARFDEFGATADFHLAGSLANGLRALRSTWSKFVHLIAWAPIAVRHEVAVRVVDRFIADALSDEEVLNAALGEPSEKAAAILALSEIIGGKVVETASTSSESDPDRVQAVLGRLLSTGALPETKRVLIDHVVSELRGSETWTESGKRDEEKTAVRDVVLRLVLGLEVIGGALIADAIADRMAQVINVGGSKGLIQGLREFQMLRLDPEREVGFLLALLRGRHQKTIGAPVYRALDRFLSLGGNFHKIFAAGYHPTESFRRAALIYRALSNAPITRRAENVSSWEARCLPDDGA
ncbi:MAG: hypothetical protein HQ481_15440 [Alphaproteobacteria bacterium]|nr:hypothetical protein [Alphaproteobacteria bacterium]